MVGAKRADETKHYEWEERRAVAAQERKAKELAKELQAVKDREAELEAIRSDAEERASVKMEAKEKDLESKKKGLEKQNAAVLEAMQNIERLTKEAEAKTQAAEALHSANAGDAGGELLCSICWNQPKCMMLEPCKHVPICEACYECLKTKECPLCRSKYTTATKLFL